MLEILVFTLLAAAGTASDQKCLNTTASPGAEVAKVNSTLTVNNGGVWGEWGQVDMCPIGFFTIGYKMKIQDYQVLGDDTALNGISLLCANLEGYMEGNVTSCIGHRGEWTVAALCHETATEYTFIRAFDLQVEGNQTGIYSDDTTANWIKFVCGLLDESVPHEHLSVDPGHGRHGEFGQWSKTCEAGSAVCGIQTKVEGDQGEGDDTTLNDVKLFCCSVSEEFNSQPVVGK